MAKRRAAASAPPREGVPPEWRDLLLSIPGYDPISTAAGAWFDGEAARLALDFFPAMLRHVEGPMAGQPFRLERWQQAFLANLFGWKVRDADGRTVRRYRECLVYIPRKNGKTPLGAGIGLRSLFCDPEAGQQNFLAAATREQAGKTFRHCRLMVEREPDFRKVLRVYGGNASAGQSRSIVREEDLSFLKVIAADDAGTHGDNASLIIVDELHAQESRDLIDVLQTGM